MGYLKFLNELWQKPKQNLGEIYRNRLIQYKKSNAIVRVDKPTRINRARSFGYKAKQGIVVVRVRLVRGGRKRALIKKGRRSKHRRRKKIVGKSYQLIAEERANRRFRNCEVLGSYLLAKDGRYAFYEVILADRNHPSIANDKDINWITKQRGKVFRGKTSAGRASRGLRRGKGKGREKIRPSLKAHQRRGKS